MSAIHNLLRLGFFALLPTVAFYFGVNHLWSEKCEDEEPSRIVKKVEAPEGYLLPNQL